MDIITAQLILYMAAYYASTALANYIHGFMIMM